MSKAADPPVAALTVALGSGLESSDQTISADELLVYGVATQDSLWGEASRTSASRRTTATTCWAWVAASDPNRSGFRFHGWIPAHGECPARLPARCPHAGKAGGWWRHSSRSRRSRCTGTEARASPRALPCCSSGLSTLSCWALRRFCLWPARVRRRGAAVYTHYAAGFLGGRAALWALSEQHPDRLHPILQMPGVTLLYPWVPSLFGASNSTEPRRSPPWTGFPACQRTRSRPRFGHVLRSPFAARGSGVASA